MVTSPTPGPFDWLEAHERDAWSGLLAVVRRAFPEVARQMRDDHDLLPVHYHILVSLHEAPDHMLRLSDLAEDAALSQSRLTQRLQILIKRGAVVVNPDPTDGRAKRATLTADGQALVIEVSERHGATVRRLIFDHLSPEQSTSLGEALRPVSRSLSGQHDGPNTNA